MILEYIILYIQCMHKLLMDEDYTSLRLKKKTLKRLAKEGNYGESMDEIINKILDASETMRT